MTGKAAKTPPPPSAAQAQVPGFDIACAALDTISAAIARPISSGGQAQVGRELVYLSLNPWCTFDSCPHQTRGPVCDQALPLVASTEALVTALLSTPALDFLRDSPRLLFLQSAVQAWGDLVDNNGGRNRRNM